MGSAFSHRTMESNAPAMQGVTNLENYGQGIGLGRAGKSARGVLNQMSSGDYGNLAGTLLSPIHDHYATQQRELTRNNLMGGNAMVSGSQPALMAGLEDETRRQMAEGEGMAYGQAIPQLYGQAANQYQNALNAQTGAQMGALQGGLQGRLAANQYITQPGWMDRVGQVAGIASQIGGMAMGIPAMGGGGGMFGAGASAGGGGGANTGASQYAHW